LGLGLKFNPKFINGTVAALIFKLKVLEGYHQNLQKTNILEAKRLTNSINGCNFIGWAINLDIKKLKKMTELINNKIKKIQASSYNSSLRSHPSELAEVRNILNIASKTLPRHKIYFENMIEKAGFTNFHLSDTLDVLKHILELLK